ncbi:MAG: protein kinase, partial [Gemmataceae bacterium]|nr:protein kinase [Gemmataceae bacterium]
MRTTCPRCLRSLSTADPGGPPVFCMYCGQKLRDDAPTATAPAVGVSPGDLPTTDLAPFTDNPEDTTDLAGPAEVGGYRLLRKLGTGGMGTVYEAEAPGTGARVAVKLLSPRLASNPASVERFRQEGRLASQLSHPRCVFVLAADTDAGRPYIVMELMPGKTLKDLVDERGPLPPAEAVAHTLDVVDGLTEAHRLGVLHRDVKPSNCFLTADGRAKVGDFGLSKSLAGSPNRQITQSGAFLGTVLFASPEQLKSEPLDYTSDVYSVCATLYYLLCGQPPYHHESVTAALLKTAEGPPESLRAKRPGVSRSLERAVMRGLEQDRVRRWQTLDELRDALAALLPSRQVPARPRSLVGAYVLDSILLLLFVQTPVEMAGGLLDGAEGPDGVSGRFFPVELAVSTAYFALLEGLFGATVGKWLLGLRVSRVGRTGPPGVGPALVRAAAFNALWAAV